MAEDPNIKKYLDMNIEYNVKDIKDTALKNKQLLRNFLEGFKIDDDNGTEMAINDYINYKMLDDLEKEENSNYTYWTDTGLTWSSWYKKLLKNLSDEQYKSITTGYFKFHYIIAEKDILKTNIEKLFKFTTLLSEKINEKITKFNEYAKKVNKDANIIMFETKVKLVNIKEDGSLDFIYDGSQLFKEPSCNIRLIIVPKTIGGAKFRKHGILRIPKYRQTQIPQRPQ